ncbi:hypothetical protein [Chlorobium sp. KB01]|uniref:hypothetical protein n=1 Tax=Chlorobium sp. KB01 TaxID=1917528 RepID=UPI000977A880|nr:hypothetical protein [Chlorobium sp. KB01]
MRLPIYRTIERTKKDHGVLTRNPGKKAFTLLFNGDTLPAESGALQVVHVESIDEASRFLQLLGNTCEIFLSPDYRMTHPGVYAFVKALLYPSQNALPPFDINTAAALMQKLPFDLKSLVKSPLAITLDDKYPCPINKKFVHKKMPPMYWFLIFTLQGVCSISTCSARRKS